MKTRTWYQESCTFEVYRTLLILLLVAAVIDSLHLLLLYKHGTNIPGWWGEKGWAVFTHSFDSPYRQQALPTPDGRFGRQ